MELTRSIINFKNDFTLEQGLEMTFDWYKGRMTEDRNREISEFEIRKWLEGASANAEKIAKGMKYGA